MAGSNICLCVKMMPDDDCSYDDAEEDEDELYLQGGYLGEDSYYADEIDSEEANDRNFNEEVQQDNLFWFHASENEDF